MRAGLLDREIRIDDLFEIVPDEYGTANRVRTGAFRKVRAQVLQYDTTDREGARPTTTATITFRIYWVEGVSLESRVLFDGQFYKIKKVREIGRRAGLELVVERVGS
jgi:hypothetical protein